MADTTGDSAPHEGLEQDGHPDQTPLPNPEAPGAGNQEGQQAEENVVINVMLGDVPYEINKRQECTHLLKRIGCSVDAAQTIL